jgi:uncharacterized protein YciI
MTAITTEEVMQKVQSGRPYTLLFLLAGKEPAHDEATMQQMQMEHLAHLFTMERDNKISVFGPVNGEGALRGIIIFNTTDADTIRSWMSSDPYIENGYLTCELHNLFTLPGQTIQPY